MSKQNEELREQCMAIQVKTGLTDIGWKEQFGNEEGLYGFLDHHISKAVREELEIIEPMTHEGRGTILWEMDDISTYINTRIAELKAKQELHENE